MATVDVEYIYLAPIEFEQRWGYLKDEGNCYLHRSEMGHRFIMCLNDNTIIEEMKNGNGTDHYSYYV